ncbi:MAG: tRNA pseudouridine(38-40) synthase TruA [Deltaproteobacteria bacterium]|nr:tRNA pseudouridine(38-40) synthase TruA [Deltaproteobacteria bacterium]
MSDELIQQRNIKLLIEYDGSRYHGWQMQKNGPSIQAEITNAIATITKEKVNLCVAGRTDAGVHATGQVANFYTQSNIPAERFAAALNTVLPFDISIHCSKQVPDNFHSRLDSESKRYCYQVYNAKQRSALTDKYAWFIRRRLDIAVMKQGATLLLGEQDFEAFRSSQCDAEHAWRYMNSITIDQEMRPPIGALVKITFHANAFCRHMCRILAGTLIEVGMGKRSASDISAALAKRKREFAGITAPAHGLTLLEVIYPK